MAIPTQLQSNQDIIRLNTQLQNLRSEFSLAASQIQSGAWTIKRTIQTLVVDILAKIEEIRIAVEYTVIPKSDAAGFDAGTVFLDDYADFDTQAYYNGLNKLRLFIRGIDVALLQVRDQEQLPVSAAAEQAQSALDVLDDAEFLDQGYSKPVQEAEYDYKYYTVVQNDSLPAIAQKALGDFSRWPDIARVNKITNADVVSGDLLGRVLRIPIQRATFLNRGRRNLVYEAMPDEPTDKQIEKYLFGVDIFVNSEANLEVDRSNDLRTVEGISCVVANLADRISTKKGGLNPLHPEFGVRLLSDAGNVPYAVMLDRHLKDFEGQVKADPRVSDATIERRKLRFEGDTVKAEMDIRLHGGTREKISVEVGANG